MAEANRTRAAYGLRPVMEERHRQLKCFSDREAFSARVFTRVVHPVVFGLLTYSLLQWYLLRQGRQDLTRRTPPRTQPRRPPTQTVLLRYYQNYVAYLTPLQHQELVLSLSATAQKKILAKTRRLRRHLARAFLHPRPR